MDGSAEIKVHAICRNSNLGCMVLFPSAAVHPLQLQCLLFSASRLHTLLVHHAV